ncbi:50S ribosomal protein L24 [Candidatus Parvarchaeota archaeon]|nr:50S ribosomal protein L24 [Candidatus Parvarchaeota archaeon]
MKCSFCGSDIKRGTGQVYAKVDGTVLNFCSRRCMVYTLAGKDSRKFKWVKNQ